MVLTTSQKNQLHKSILQYLKNNNLPKSAAVFAEQTQLSLDSVDPQGNKMEIKWKSILSLQKKISNLEQKLQNAEQELSRAGSSGKNSANVKLQDLFVPKTPAKFQMKGHKAPITSMSFHPQYTQLATCSQDGTIKIWQTQMGQFQRTLKGHTNPVNCVAFDPTGKYIASCSSDLTIKLWDCNNDYLCCKTFNGHDHNVSYVEFVMGNDYLLSCSRDKNIKLWEISTGYCKRTFSGHQGWVRKLAVSADGKTFVSCSDDQSVIVWNMDKQAPVTRFFAHQNVIQNIILIQGQHSSILMNSDFLKHKFNTQTKIAALKKLQKQGLGGINNYQQTFILTCSRDKLIRLFTMSGQLLHTFTGHDNWVRSLVIHPTGKYLYSASDDKTVKIWDLHTAKEKKHIDAHDHFISTIKFHNKYGIIGTAGNDMIVKIWTLK